MSDPGSGLGFGPPPQELPPLRDNPALSPLAHTPVRELDFLMGDRLRDDLKTPGGRVSLRTLNAGRLSQLDVRSESANSLSDDRTLTHEVEQLKKQVARLTQLRRDRDNYIQDLLSEAEATQRRHEGEIARRTVKNQREAAERLSSQQREHDLHLEERSRAHAAALAQQAWQHEREIEELRKSLRIDAERRLAERLTEAANHHREMLLRLQLGVDELRQRLASHSAALGNNVLEDSELLVKGKEEDQRQLLAFSSSAATAAEPEPEEAMHDTETTLSLLAPRDAAEEEALAERSANEVAEAVEWAITLARKDLECALKARGLECESAHESELKDAVQLKQFKLDFSEATVRLEGDKRKLRRQTKDFAASAAAASSQTLLLKVLLVWGNEVRRLRSLVAEQQRVLNRRQQRQPLILEWIRADVDQWLHIVFRTWVTTSSNARREVADQQTLAQRVQQLLAGKARIRATVVFASHADALRSQQVVFDAWRAERRHTLNAAAQEKAMGKAATAASAEASMTRREEERDKMNLRLKRRSIGIQSIHAELEHTQRLSMRAWAAVAKAARAAEVVEEHLKRQRMELGESRRTQGLLIAQAAVEHSRLLAFHAWAAARVDAKCEADAVHRLDALTAEAAEVRAEMEKEAQGLSLRLSTDRRAQGMRLGFAHTGFSKRVILFRWAIAAREARREAAHRRQLITAAADASAEVYKLRAEAKKVSVELRKQRRAHGVAAIHANLDRRLQSVLLAWGTVVRDGQRETAYQRQLDIAAAESAAGCAVLRMEGRRTCLELREERRAQACRTIDAGIQHWQHLALREWWAQAEAARQQARQLVELRGQADDCEERVSSMLNAATNGAEASSHQVGLQQAADLRDKEVHASEVARLCTEREALQAQITKLHDELRRHHGQP